MTIQYVRDQDDKTTVVLVPIEELAAMQRQLCEAYVMTASDLEEHKEAFEALDKREALDLRGLGSARPSAAWATARKR